MPTVRSQTLAGNALGALAGGFVPREHRWIQFNAKVDVGGLPQVPDLTAKYFQENLIKRIGEAADAIIALAKTKLVPGHGYDTGLMHNTLTKHLEQAALESMSGVFYDLESDEAWYWVFVEFGHMLRNGNWWPGYYFLSSSVTESEAMLRQKIRQAWSDTVVMLAEHARVDSADYNIVPPGVSYADYGDGPSD